MKERQNISSYMTIKNEKYDIDAENRTVTCTIACKINLNELERQFMSMNKPFIKNVIGNYLPIIKAIYNYNYSDSPVVKYYIVPGEDVKVLDIDNEYFEEYKNTDVNHYMGEYINRKDVLNACYSDGEVTYFEYCETFKTTGRAVCDEHDEFDETIGKSIALNKATRTACLRVIGLYSKINEFIGIMQNDVRKGIDTFADTVFNINEFIDKFKETENPTPKNDN